MRQPNLGGPFRWLICLAIACMMMAGSAGAQNAFTFRSDHQNAAARPWTAVPADQPEMLRFAVIGDRTGLARPGVFERAIRQVGLLHPELIINTGDLIEGYTDNEQEIEIEWQPIEEAIARLGVPFVYVPGNHDFNTDASVRAWQRRHGATHFWFSYKNVLFIVLNSEDPPLPMEPERAARFRQTVKNLNADPIGFIERYRRRLANANSERAEATDLFGHSRFSDAQVEFVRKTLDAHKGARWTFVLMHKPGWKRDSGNFARIEQLLAGRNSTVVAGHNHYFEHQVRDGRDYFVTGTAGGISHQEGPGKMDHVLWVTVPANQPPEFAVIKLNGILDQDGNPMQSPFAY